MPATGYILPASIDLTVLIGADFSTTINLYQDTAQTTAFDLTGYTCSMIIGYPNATFTLTSGSGLTVTAASGQIVAALTATQTSSVGGAAPGEPVYKRYQLKLVDGSGVASYPLSGNMAFTIA